jgi:hypothetical protein
VNEDEARSIIGRTVYLVKETSDIDTYVDHGVFSTDDLATDYINRKTGNAARWRRDGKAADAKYGVVWDITSFTVDEPEDPFDFPSRGNRRCAGGVTRPLRYRCDEHNLPDLAAPCTLPHKHR